MCGVSICEFFIVYNYVGPISFLKLKLCKLVLVCLSIEFNNIKVGKTVKIL